MIFQKQENVIVDKLKSTFERMFSEVCLFERLVFEIKQFKNYFKYIYFTFNKLYELDSAEQGQGQDKTKREVFL